MPKLKVIFLRNNTPGFEGALPKLPNELSALYLDGNTALSSVNAKSICASAPASGWRTGGCTSDWPSPTALTACCMDGDAWPSTVYSMPCLQPCFKTGPPAPTPPPTPTVRYMYRLYRLIENNTTMELKLNGFHIQLHIRTGIYNVCRVIYNVCVIAKQQAGGRCAGVRMPGPESRLSRQNFVENLQILEKNFNQK